MSTWYVAAVPNHCFRVYVLLQGVAAPHFTATAGALDFNWGDDTGKLVEALITFLYLDFIGSSITFVSMGQMCGILDDKVAHMQCYACSDLACARALPCF